MSMKNMILVHVIKDGSLLALITFALERKRKKNFVLITYEKGKKFIATDLPPPKKRKMVERIEENQFSKKKKKIKIVLVERKNKS